MLRRSFDKICQFHFRLLPKLISVIVAKKFKITIRFGRIGLPFTLLNVEICKNGYSLVGVPYGLVINQLPSNNDEVITAYRRNRNPESNDQLRGH